MNLLTIGIRNLFRNTRRTILTVSGICIGLVCLLIIGGYYEFNYWGLRESFIRSQFGHIQISKKDYLNNKNTNPYGYLISDYQEIIDSLESIKEVDCVSPRLQLTGLLDTENFSSLVLVRGIIPEKENEFNTFFSKKKGNDLNNDDYEYSELGTSLALNANLDINDNFYLSMVDSFGVQNAMLFTVKSEIGSYSEEFDSKIVRLPLQALQDLSNTDGIHEIAIVLKNTQDTQKVKRIIQTKILNKYNDLIITTWDQQAGYYSQVVSFYGNYFAIVIFLVMVVVFFSTFSTLLLSLNERYKEIGTIESFGAKKSYIVRMLFVEGTIISILSLISAYILSFTIAGIISLLGGIPVAPPPGISNSFHVFIRFTLKNFVITLLIGIIVPLLAVLISMKKVIKSSIVNLVNSTY